MYGAHRALGSQNDDHQASSGSVRRARLGCKCLTPVGYGDNFDWLMDA